MLGEAIKLASAVFADKKDKAGKPYIMHCIRVMMNVDSTDEELQTIAILHDVVEDSEYTIEDLHKMGFSYRVCQAVSLLTHTKGEEYMTYIRRLATNPDAKAVKRADLKDNSDITRLKGLREKDFQRMEKYHIAWMYLSN